MLRESVYIGARRLWSPSLTHPCSVKVAVPPAAAALAALAAASLKPMMVRRCLLASQGSGAGSF